MNLVMKGCLLALVALAGTRSLGWAQDTPTGDRRGLLAGYYQGDPSSFNGPIISLWYDRPIGGPVFRLGIRGDFRDDDDSGGRVQALALNVEAKAAVGTPISLMALAGAGPVVSFLSDPPMFGEPDVEEGLGFDWYYGLSLIAYEGVVEYRVIRGSPYKLHAISLGAASRPYKSADHSVSSVSAWGSTLAGASGSYNASEGYRGYSIAYERAIRRSAPGRLRATFGIDFLDFETTYGSWSTGAVALTVGLPMTPSGDTRRILSLSLVPELGAWLFSEPGVNVYPIAKLGLEPSVTLSDLAISINGSVFAANAPAGWFVGTFIRLGVKVHL